MEARIYYVEKRDETLQTTDRLEAARIAAEWIRRGYEVETAVCTLDGYSEQDDFYVRARA